jgi:acyl carrier protein
MEQQVIRFIDDVILGGSGSGVSIDDEIVLDGTVDSLGVTRLLDFIEESLGVAVPAEDVTIENFQSVRTICAYVRTRAGDPQGEAAG